MPAAVLMLGMAAGCGDPTGPAVQGPLPDVSAWVTGAAAAALDANGHFDLPRPRRTADEISPEYADSVAKAYVRTFVTNPDAIGGLRADLDESRGAPIRWSAVGTRQKGPYWAYTPYQYDGSGLPANARNLLGPQYLVPFYQGHTQVAVGIVPARATDIGIDGGGLLDLPSGGAPGLDIDATPHESRYRIPLSPEEAVESVGTQSPALVTEPPRYIGPGAAVLASYGRWEVVLDRQIDLRRGDGTRTSSDTLFVGLDVSLVNGRPDVRVQWYLPTTPQPEPFEITFPYRTAAGDVDFVAVTVTVREDTPLEFYEVFPPP